MLDAVEKRSVSRNPLEHRSAGHAVSPGTQFERLYTAHPPSGCVSWLEMFREAKQSRELTYRLFVRDFTARYRQSVLGYLWALMPAIATVVTFGALRQANVLPAAPEGIPYVLWVLVGISVWQLFASGLAMSTQALVYASSFITKINFPRESLVFASFGLSLFELAIRSVALVAAFVVFQHAPYWTAALVPLAIVPLALLTLGLGMALAMANTVMRDIGQIISFVLPFWMLLTPIAYRASGEGIVGWAAWLNPVSPFVIAAQDLCFRGSLSQPVPFALASCLGIIVFLTGWRLFHLAESRVAELV